MYITQSKTTSSVQIPDSYPLTDEQAAIVQAHYPYFDLTVEDGAITAITPTEPLAPTDPEPSPPTAEEQLRADVDYIAVMTGVAL
ncbi:MAG: hypothetical protein AB7C89_06455 [Intestinibacillus sp.]